MERAREREREKKKEMTIANRRTAFEHYAFPKSKNASRKAVTREPNGKAAGEFMDRATNVGIAPNRRDKGR